MKDIKGYEGLYAITSCGRVWSYRRKKFLSPSKDKGGYLQVVLHNNGEIKRFVIHRLVAEAYISNPDNLPEVNHKDEIKNHNWINNLEWVSHKENVVYGTRIERAAAACRKPVYCVELNKVFESGKQAAEELKINAGSISCCCKGRYGYKTAGGYHWKYAS